MYPEYVEVNDRKYKINTDFRVAIRCNKIAEDKTIGDFERALGVIYLLFGEDGINTPEDYEKLLEMAEKYLLCGKEKIDDKNVTPDMDFEEDYAYIKTSFRSDYGMNIDKEQIHWWEFMDLMNGLSNSELGNCCILNRVRNLRNYDTKDIKDTKEKQRIEEAKKSVALKKNQKKATKEQIKSAEILLDKLGLRKE
jgi:hypothetical protein